MVPRPDRVAAGPGGLREVESATRERSRRSGVAEYEGRGSKAVAAENDSKDECSIMKMTRPRLIMRLIVLASALAGPAGCAPKVAPAPAPVRRIAVLPPCDATGAPLSPRASAGPSDTPSQRLDDVLASEARNQLARHGFQVVDPRVVEIATGGRVPSSPEIAAEIVRSSRLDATALFLRVRRWELPYPTLRTNEIIVSLDAMLVDPATGEVVWEVRRPAKPVRLHGELMGGQAAAVAAEEVMKEVFSPLGRRLQS